MHNEKKCVNGTLHHCKEKATLEVLQNKTRYKEKKTDGCVDIQLGLSSN
jgi:hypothetical protein